MKRWGMGCEWGYFKGPPRIKSHYVMMLTPCLTWWWLHHIAVMVAHIPRKRNRTGWFLKLKILHGKLHQPQFWNNIEQMKILIELISSFCLLTGLTWMFNWKISWTSWKTRTLFSRKDRAHSDSIDIQLYLGLPWMTSMQGNPLPPPLWNSDCAEHLYWVLHLHCKGEVAPLLPSRCCQTLQSTNSDSVDS